MAIGRNRGSGHSGGPCDAPTSQQCSEPDPRNPSGPAVNSTAHTGRTHDRNRPDPSQLHKILVTAGAVHTWVPAFAGNAVDFVTRVVAAGTVRGEECHGRP